MLNMDQKLLKREEEGKIIRTGIVGAGQMGRGMVTQMAIMKGISPSIVSDIKIENVINAFHYAGISDEQIAIAKTLEDANKYMEMGKFVATDNSDLISQANLVECAIDVTGVPEVGVKIAIDSMNNGKHVVMMDVETDVVIGSYLKKLGDKNGVVYTGSAGDEPGAVMELYSFAKAMVVFHPPAGVAFLPGFVRAPGPHEHGVPLLGLDPRDVAPPGLSGSSFTHVLLGVDVRIDVHVAHLPPFVNGSGPEGPYGGGAVGFQVRVVVGVGRHAGIEVAALGEHVQVPAGKVGGFRPVGVEQVHHDDVGTGFYFVTVPAGGNGKR